MLRENIIQENPFGVVGNNTQAIVSGLPDIVRTLDNLITVNSSKHPISDIKVDSTILHGHPSSFLGHILKNDPDSRCRKFGDPFPFEWVFPESKINKMSEFVHLFGKATSPSSMEEAELRNAVVSGIQSWRHSTAHTLFESNSHHTFS